jgi:hypothetical protein
METKAQLHGWLKHMEQAIQTFKSSESADSDDALQSSEHGMTIGRRLSEAF